jgi:hypothetical protein
MTHSSSNPRIHASAALAVAWNPGGITPRDPKHRNFPPTPGEHPPLRSNHEAQSDADSWTKVASKDFPHPPHCFPATMHILPRTNSFASLAIALTAFSYCQLVDVRRSIQSYTSTHPSMPQVSHPSLPDNATNPPLAPQTDETSIPP